MVYADNRIKKYLRGDMLHIYSIGVANGLRVSDILNLRVRALYIKQPTITEIKTRKKKRIYIPADTRKDLIDSCKNRSATENDYIFISSATGRPYSRQAVWKAFKTAEEKVCKEYGDKVNVGTHSMRKSYAQKLLRKGKSYKEIQARLNHSQLGDSLRYLIDGGKNQ